MGVAEEKGIQSKGVLQDRNFYRPADARAFKAAHYVERQGAVRLYSTMYGSAWQLQVRCNLGIGPSGMKEGKDFVIAGADLGVEAMKELRDAITAMLKDCGAE